MNENFEILGEGNGEHEEKYGDISHLELEPMKLDGDKMSELGMGGGGPALSSAVMRYTAGCIKRERERLAKVFIQNTSPQAIARAILDCSLDDFVFKWNGPEVRLETLPKSNAEREAEKVYKPES